MSSGTSTTSFWHSRLAAALVTGAFSLAAVMLGYWLGTRAQPPESYDVLVDAKEYPLADTNIRVNEGDVVEIRVMEANDTRWDCGTGATNAMGFAEMEWDPARILALTNFCSLIGRIEGGPHFVVGAYDKFIADVSGSLFLGANDAPPELCLEEDCYDDNQGEQFVKVTITRK